MSHLSRGKLANVAQVAAGSTSAVVTVAGNNNVYVKSIIIHDGSNIGSVGVANTAHVYLFLIMVVVWVQQHQQIEFLM